MAAKSTKKADPAALKALALKRAKKLGLSYTKPDSGLSPSQLANRKAIQKARANDRNPLYDPSQSLTGNVLAKTVDKLATDQFAPQERQANQSIQNVGTQYDALQKNAAGYMGQVGARDDRSSARQAAISRLLTERLGGISNESAATVQGQRTDELARSQADQAIRGGGPSSTTELDAEGARAATQTGALQQAGALQNANQESLQGDLAQARQVRGAEIQSELSTKRANDLLTQQQALKDLAAQRAAFKTDKTLSLRDQAFTNALAQSTLNVKGDQIAATIDNNKRTTTVARQNAHTRAGTARSNRTAAAERASQAQDRLDARQRASLDSSFLQRFGKTKAEFDKLSPAAKDAAIAKFGTGKTGKGKGATTKDGLKPLTTLQIRSAVSNVKGARANAQTLMSKPGANSSEVRQLLRSGATGHKYTEDEINAAFDLLPPALGGNGGLSPANIKALGPQIAGVFPKAKKKPGVVLPIVGRVGAT